MLTLIVSFMIKRQWFDIQWWYIGYKKSLIKFFSDPFALIRKLNKWRKETACWLRRFDHDDRSVFDSIGYYSHSECRRCGRRFKW